MERLKTAIELFRTSLSSLHIIFYYAGEKSGTYNGLTYTIVLREGGQNDVNSRGTSYIGLQSGIF